MTSYRMTAAPSFPVEIADLALLEANTLANASWLAGPPPISDYNYDDMVYRYRPNGAAMPTSGVWRGEYSELMSFRSTADIESARLALTKRIFSGSPLLLGTHTRLATVGDHDEYEVDMRDWLTTSRIWLYRATVRPRSGTLLIVHGGHGNHGPIHPDLIQIRTDALGAGHDVLVVSMPGQSVNAVPGPTGNYFGANGPLASHQNLPLWNRYYLNQTFVSVGFGTPAQSGYHVFYAPVHRMLNSIGSRYDRIAMTGLSGGASTSLHCAALDTRIRACYAVAGGGVVPRFAYYANAYGGSYSDFGDCGEDQDKTWFGPGSNVAPGDNGLGANEEETLTMVASQSRRAMIVTGTADPVCFSLVNMELYGPAAVWYASAIGGGTLSYVRDVNTTHSWSPAIRARILADMATLP